MWLSWGSLPVIWDPSRKAEETGARAAPHTRARRAPPPWLQLRCWVLARSGVAGDRRSYLWLWGWAGSAWRRSSRDPPRPAGSSRPETPPGPRCEAAGRAPQAPGLQGSFSHNREPPRTDFSRGFGAPSTPRRPLLSLVRAAPAMAALRRLLWPPPRLPPPRSAHQPFPGPWGRPAVIAPGPPGRPFSRREEEEGAVAQAAWRRRRRWGELSIAAAAGGGLVGLVCYQLYGDAKVDSARAPAPGRPFESAAPEPEDPPRGRGLLPIPVAAAKETVCAWARARAPARPQVTRERGPGVPPERGQGRWQRAGCAWDWATVTPDIGGCRDVSSADGRAREQDLDVLGRAATGLFTRVLGGH